MLSANAEARMHLLFQYRKQITVPFPHWQEPSGSSSASPTPNTAEYNEETSILSLKTSARGVRKKPKVKLQNELY